MTEPANSYQVGGDHYKRMPVEPWTIIDTWPLEQQVGFYRGNAVKYMMRAGMKGGWVGDLKKAQHYLDKLIGLMEETDNASR